MFLLLLITFCVACIETADLPPSAADWDLENENPKFVNESCKKDSDCYGSESSFCNKNKCDCRENYVPGLRFVGKNGVQLVCEPGPAVYELCTHVCQKPSVCTKPKNKTVTYVRRNQDITVEVVDKICLCEPPYQYDIILEGCVLDCGEDETYDKKTLKCVTDLENKKCNAKTEIQHKGVCLPVSPLGKDCSNDVQCQDTFAECRKGKCLCKETFDTVEGKCVPFSFNCPYGGNVLTKGKELVTCKKFKVAPKCPNCNRKEDENSPTIAEGDVVRYVPPGELPTYLFNVQNQPLADDCPPNYYCSVLYGNPDNEGSGGYCCPILTLDCPVGEVLTNVSCEALFGDTDEQYCPSKTHYCHYIFSREYQKTICCPKPCYSNFVYASGLCYEPATTVGGKCEVNEQCESVNAKCVKGVCLCPEKMEKFSSICVPVCNNHKVLLDNECVALLKLGDSCTSDSRCPKNSVCNKKRKCVCNRDTFHFGDECFAQPNCDYNDPRVTAIKPMKLEITDFLKNATLCKIPHIESSKLMGNIVDKCSKDQFCKSYATTVGLCCPRVENENVCSRGKPLVGKFCNLQNSTSCIGGYVCISTIDSYNFADEQSDERGVCCPN